MSDDLPALTSWEHLGGNVWALAGEHAAYTSLSFTPEWNDDGDWSATLPYTVDAEPLTRAGILVLVEFRGWSGAFRVVPNWELGDDGDYLLTAGGPGASALLSDEAAWPDPTAGVGAQPDPPALYSGAAETVVRKIVGDNYITRAGSPLELRNDHGTGSPVRARSRFANLGELARRKARAGGIGVGVELVRTSDTRASLQLALGPPRDRSADVTLSEDLGTLAGYKTSVTPPTLTEAIVPRADGSFVLVTTAASRADAAIWGRRSALVPAPDSYDDPDLQQAGEEALADGASKVNVALSAADTDGLVSLSDYLPGDLVTVSLRSGLSAVETLGSIEVSVTVDDSGASLDVTPKVGDPSTSDPTFGLGELIRSQNRRLRAQERRG